MSPRRKQIEENVQKEEEVIEDVPWGMEMPETSTKISDQEETDANNFTTKDQRGWEIQAGGDRPPRQQYGDRPPQRGYGDRPPRQGYGDRYQQRDGDRQQQQYGDRQQQQYGDRQQQRDGDRYQQRDGGRYQQRDGGRYQQRDGDRYQQRDGDRYQQRDGDRFQPRGGAYGDRPQHNTYGQGGYSDRRFDDRQGGPDNQSFKRRQFDRSTREETPPTEILGIFNLSHYADENSVENFVRESIGDLSYNRFALVKDRDTGRSRGFAFFTFNNIDDAKLAKERLSGKIFYERELRLDFSQPKQRQF